MIRSTLRFAVAALALASPLLVLPAAATPAPAPAAAAAVPLVQTSSFGSCYSRSGYSFKHETLTGKRIIHAYSGTSCGNEISAGIVTRNSSTNTITLNAEDRECDSRGITLYTHGPSRTDSSCTAPGSIGTYQPSAFSSPLNFWINVAGVNSNAMNLP